VRFGTDGVRGVANAELTPEFALALGRATAAVLGGERAVIGRDPRRSGPMLEAGLAAGMASAGVDVELLGVVPTPAVAWVCAADGVVGAMISASHNPAPDNGIKLFGPGGTKLSDRVQVDITTEIERVLGAGPFDTARPVGAQVGDIRAAGEGTLSRYRDSLLGALEGRRLDGLRVVLDCANGASSTVAPEVFRAAGAEVTVLHAWPDGLNINERCGSTDPADLADAVPEAGADVGFAFDGDADRVLAVDVAGRVIDGDQLMAIMALDLNRRGLLRAQTLVVTVMSNLGLLRSMAANGIRVLTTPVGDRHVLETLDEGGFSLGGEQSGHLIFRDLATTGDGILGALLVADTLVRRGQGLGELADAAMTRLPQVLRNVALANRPEHLEEQLAELSSAAASDLGDRGRVLIRPSGTEPLVRVMVEADEEPLAAAVADQLCDQVRRLTASEISG
jgi:phosphoglucosamine mutase